MITVIPRLMRSLIVRILGMRSFEDVQIDSGCAFWQRTQNFLDIFTLMIYQWGSDNHLVSSDFQQTWAYLLKIWWILDSSDFQQICKNYFNGDPVITWSSENMQKLWHCFWKSHLRQSESLIITWFHRIFSKNCAFLLKIRWILVFIGF